MRDTKHIIDMKAEVEIFSLPLEKCNKRLAKIEKYKKMVPITDEVRLDYLEKRETRLKELKIKTGYVDLTLEEFFEKV